MKEPNGFVTCPICKKELRSLYKHIHIHKISVAQFKIKFAGCQLESAVVKASKRTPERLIAATKRALNRYKNDVKYRQQANNRAVLKRQTRRMNKTVECLICHDYLNNQKGLASHLKLHKITVQEYYNQFLRQLGDGQCVICQSPTAFRSGRYLSTCGKSQCSSKLGWQNFASDFERLSINLKKRSVSSKRLMETWVATGRTLDIVKWWRNASDEQKNAATRKAVCTRAALGLCTDDSHSSSFKRFSKEVRCKTRLNYQKYKDFINSQNLPIGRNQYHVDHKVSIIEAFRRGWSVIQAAAVENLQILYYKDNLSKGVKSCGL